MAHSLVLRCGYWSDMALPVKRANTWYCSSEALNQEAQLQQCWAVPAAGPVLGLRLPGLQACCLEEWCARGV